MSYVVLVVDDSPVMRAIVKKSLHLAGLDLGAIHEAGNGREALALLRQYWIDVVLTDLHMPEVDGPQLVEEMQRDHVLGSIPVVVVSSNHNPECVEQLKQRGVRAYLTKPFRPERLKETLLAVLHSREGGCHG
jgi:two-component system, chemotaxis family, chemotaxis protein CheY